MSPWPWPEWAGGWGELSFTTTTANVLFMFANSLRGIQERNTMSKQIETLAELRALNQGDAVLVRQDGTMKAVRWLVGDGVLTEGEATLDFGMFEAAIQAGNVFAQGTYHLGQTFRSPDGTRFAKIMAREGDLWVIAESDTHGYARAIRCYAGMPLGMTDRPEFANNAILVPAWEMGYRAYQADQIQARLDLILQTGEIPEEAQYTVEVEVAGRTQVTPSDRDAGRMLGFRGAKVSKAEPFEVVWTKRVSVVHTSRWGCACNQVTADEVNAIIAAEKATATVTAWTVSGCAPEGEESAVHTAA